MQLLIDGNSLLNRAFYALKQQLTAPDGTPTGALHGFFTMIIKARAELNPDHIAIAWDLKAPTFRHKMFEGYKATRHGMPDDLAAQLPIAKELSCSLGFGCIEFAGYEADDILGTLASAANARGESCVIATGDRDSLQLVSEHTLVRLATNFEHKLFGVCEVEAKYGLSPAQLVDLKALMGDSSDNIPGVPGIGEKTASDLMQKCGSLDEIYADIDKIDTTPRVKKLLTEGKESALLSRELGRIVCDVPLPEQPASREDKPAAVAELTRLGLRSVIKLLDPAAAAAPAPAAPASGQISLFGDTPTPAEPAAVPQPEAIEKLERELEPILREMEQTGFLVDQKSLEEFGRVLDEEIKKLTGAIAEIAGEGFNPNSTKETGELLFEKLSLPHGKKTKTGYSTAADVLEKLTEHHIIVPLLLAYRKLTKLHSTFVVGIAKKIAPDGRVHTTFTSTDTRTGRIASKDPNLQNIPIREEIGRQLRRFFVAPEGSVLVGADYSQIELRVLASIANDSAMLAAFKNGEDIHAATAKRVFGSSDPEHRRRAKAVNFGIVYGIGAFSLAKDIGVSVAEAKEYIESYLAVYSGVADYMREVVEKATADGFTQTLLGRTRYIPELAAKNHALREFGKRVALNSPIQGTAADIIKTAMVNVHKRLLSENIEARLILQVHDELILESTEASAQKAAAALKEEMENACALAAPLVADVSVGRCWGECH